MELLRNVTSKHFGEFYCFKYPHLFRKKQQLEFHKKVCENKDYYGVVMPSKDIKIVKFNQYKNFAKTPYIISVDLEYLIKRIDGYKNNSGNSSTAKVKDNIPCVCSMSTICWLRYVFHMDI